MHNINWFNWISSSEIKKDNMIAKTSISKKSIFIDKHEFNFYCWGVIL